MKIFQMRLFTQVTINPISTRGGPCYTFINNFLFTSAFFVKFSDFS